MVKISALALPLISLFLIQAVAFSIRNSHSERLGAVQVVEVEQVTIAEED